MLQMANPNRSPTYLSNQYGNICSKVQFDVYISHHLCDMLRCIQLIMLHVALCISLALNDWCPFSERHWKHFGFVQIIWKHLFIISTEWMTGYHEMYAHYFNICFWTFSDVNAPTAIWQTKYVLFGRKSIILFGKNCISNWKCALCMCALHIEWNEIAFKSWESS